MKTIKIARLLYLLAAVFVMSFVFALINSKFSQISSYELGKLAGQIMRHSFKIIGILALSVLAIKTFNKSNNIKQTHNT